MSMKRTVITALVVLALVAVTTAAAAPYVTGVAPETGVRGTTITIEVTGAGFAEGAKVLAYGGGTAIWASSVAFVSASSLKATLAIPANAYLGKYAVYVQNPGAYSWVYKADCFTVGTSSPAPVLVSPPDGSVFYNIPREVTLIWGSIRGATGYKVERQFQNPGDDTWIPLPDAFTGQTGQVQGEYRLDEMNCSYTFTFVGDNKGRWRVTALGVATPTPSAWWSFEFTSTIPLPTPTLIVPANGIVLNHFPRWTTLSWTPVPSATGYRLERQFYSSQWDSYPIPDLAGVQSTAYTFKHIGAQPGRWRVTALAGGAPGLRDSPPSDWWTFTYSV